jgi:hypothetical protein
VPGTAVVSCGVVLGCGVLLEECVGVVVASVVNPGVVFCIITLITGSETCITVIFANVVTPGPAMFTIDMISSISLVAVTTDEDCSDVMRTDVTTSSRGVRSLLELVWCGPNDIICTNETSMESAIDITCTYRACTCSLNTASVVERDTVNVTSFVAVVRSRLVRCIQASELVDATCSVVMSTGHRLHAVYVVFPVKNPIGQGRHDVVLQYTGVRQRIIIIASEKIGVRHKVDRIEVLFISHPDSI